jgi:tetratricopeptide (TPR) repeat protein
MPEVQPRLVQMAGRRGALAAGVAAAAEGTRERQGSAAAAEMVRTAKLIDLTDPDDAAALRALVENLVAAGQAAEALAAANAALAKHPDAAAFHALHGVALGARGAPLEQVRAAYSRAVELDPERSALALAALGGIAAAAGESDAALDFYARAVEADPDDTAALVASAELLLSLERGDEAVKQLEEALERSPYDARIAARLAALVLERGGDPDRAVALARRAVRFRGGPAAEELLARAQATRGEPAIARQAEPAPAATPETR